MLYCPVLGAQQPEWSVVCLGVFAGYELQITLGVLICDLSGALGPPAVALNLEAMATAVRAHGGTAVIGTMLYDCPVPSPADTCLALPASDPGFCPQLRCFLDDACLVSTLIELGGTPSVSFVLEPTGFGDLLHPNAEGQAVLSERAASAIAAILATR